MSEKYLRLAVVLLIASLGVYAVLTHRTRARERAAREAEEAWLALGPIQNHPVRSRIFDVNFSREFNDMNETQLKVAQAIGVPPVADREAAEHLKTKLVRLEDTGTYVVDALAHSMPYLLPSAKALLE